MKGKKRSARKRGEDERRRENTTGVENTRINGKSRRRKVEEKRKLK